MISVEFGWAITWRSAEHTQSCVVKGTRRLSAAGGRCAGEKGQGPAGDMSRSDQQLLALSPSAQPLRPQPRSLDCLNRLRLLIAAIRLAVSPFDNRAPTACAGFHDAHCATDSRVPITPVDSTWDRQTKRGIPRLTSPTTFFTHHRHSIFGSRHNGYGRSCVETPWYGELVLHSHCLRQLPKLYPPYTTPTLPSTNYAHHANAIQRPTSAQATLCGLDEAPGQPQALIIRRPRQEGQHGQERRPEEQPLS